MIKAPQHLKMYDGMKNIVRDNYFRMTNEARYTIIYTEEYQKDPVLAIQLSLAVTLDKAIFLLADHKTIIPENLAKAAKKVCHFDASDVESLAAAHKTLKES